MAAFKIRNPSYVDSPVAILCLTQHRRYWKIATTLLTLTKWSLPKPFHVAATKLDIEFPAINRGTLRKLKSVRITRIINCDISRFLPLKKKQHFNKYARRNIQCSYIYFCSV